MLLVTIQLSVTDNSSWFPAALSGLVWIGGDWRSILPSDGSQHTRGLETRGCAKLHLGDAVAGGKPAWSKLIQARKNYRHLRPGTPTTPFSWLTSREFAPAARYLRHRSWLCQQICWLGRRHQSPMTHTWPPSSPWPHPLFHPLLLTLFQGLSTPWRRHQFLPATVEGREVHLLQDVLSTPRSQVRLYLPLFPLSVGAMFVLVIYYVGCHVWTYILFLIIISGCFLVLSWSPIVCRNCHVWGNCVNAMFVDEFIYFGVQCL